MRNLTIIVSALILGCAIIGAVFVVKDETLAISGSLLNSSRIVSVRGLAEREVLADRVYFPISYKLSGQDYREIVKNLDAQKEVVVNFLISKNLSKDDISFKLPEINENTYNKELPKYTVEYKLVIDSTKVKEAKDVMDNISELIKKGVQVNLNSYETEFKFTKLNEIKPEMIKESTVNARNAAVKFAQDSESSLGKIKYASQGQFSIENTSRPEIKKVRVVSTVQYYLND